MADITIHSDKLKACPFCSSPGIYEVGVNEEGGYYNLGCAARRCLAHQIYFLERMVPLESAIREWNLRAQGEEINELRSAIEDMLFVTNFDSSTAAVEGARKRAQAALRRE